MSSYFLFGLLYVAAIFLSFYLWAWLHESAHFLTVKKFRPSAEGEFKIYPHLNSGWLNWAAVSWIIYGAPLTNREKGFVYIAPRFPDAIGVITTTIMTFFLTGHVTYIIAIILGGSVVDLIYGSIGYSPRSDLRRVAEAWDISPWVLRIGGFALATVPIVTFGINVL